MDKTTLEKQLTVETKRNAMLVAKIAYTQAQCDYDIENMTNALVDSDLKVTDLQKKTGVMTPA